MAIDRTKPKNFMMRRAEKTFDRMGNKCKKLLYIGIRLHTPRYFHLADRNQKQNDGTIDYGANNNFCEDRLKNFL